MKKRAIFLTLILGLLAAVVSAETDISQVTYSVSIEPSYLKTKTFTIPATSYAETVLVNWRCDLTSILSGGYFKITAGDGKVDVLAEEKGAKPSGQFLARRGETYTIEVFGGQEVSEEDSATGYGSGSVTYTVKYGYLLYQMNFVSMGQNTGVHNHFSMYLPAGKPVAGTNNISPIGRDGYQSLNGLADLLPRPYDVPVKWVFHVDNYHGDLVDNKASAKLWISLCDRDGAKINELVYRSFRKSTASGEFTVPADKGIIVELDTGHFEHCHKASHGYDCWYSLSYQLDRTPPESSSVGLKETGNNLTINGITYTAQAPLKLEWTTPEDRGTVFDGVTYGPGGVTGYYLEYSRNGATSGNTGWISGNQTELVFEDGTYEVKIKARDFDQNESEFSEPLKFVVDRSVDRVTLPADPVEIDGDNVTLKWNKIGDISGITEYQTALTESDSQPDQTRIVKVTPEWSQYTHTMALSSKNSYYAWVRAVDGLGNIGVWTKTEIVLPPEPTSITALEPKAEIGDGGPLYKVDLTIQSVGAAIFVIEREKVGSDPAERVQTELTYAQLESGGFIYSDRNGLNKHGQYRYTVYTKNFAGQTSDKFQSGVIVIPNIAAALEINGPEPQLVTNNRTHLFDLNTKTDIEGDEVKFRVWYRLGKATFRSSDALQSEAVTVNFADGEWTWWLEAAEYCNGMLLAGSTQLSEERGLTVQTGDRLPITLPGIIETTPGKPVKLEAAINDATLQPIEYRWDPGDGGSALSGPTPEYAYNKLGEYSLTLTVRDADGVIYVIVSTVRVSNTGSGQLYLDEVWSGTHRLYGDVTVPAGIKLTIEPGTEVIIDGIPGVTGYNHALIISGSLEVNGENGGVVFSSVTGTPGGWRGIYIEGRAALTGLTVRDAERGIAVVDNAVVSINKCALRENQIGIHVYNAKPAINETVFQGNLLYGIKEDENGQPAVTGCYFSDNGINYYDQELMELSLEELNAEPGNTGNWAE